jgi:hypothetical protein
VQLAGGLFLRHEEGEFDLERLTQTRLPMLMEIAPPLLLGGALLGIEETAPEVVAQHRATVAEPDTPAERAEYVRALLDAFGEADVDLSGREINEPPDEDVQIIEIPRSGGSE